MAAPLSLHEVFATLPDPRHRRGRRHPLAAVLSLTAVALLAGMRSLEAIAQLGRDYGPALAHALGFRRKTPSKSTLSRFTRRLVNRHTPDRLAVRQAGCPTLASSARVAKAR